MDDQEIIRMKRTVGKKRRSRNSFISSGSLAKEYFELNQLLDGDNTMVYALVEVSNESNKTTKREKIPLNNRDLFHMMEKFVSSKRDKAERKLLRPMLKRKHGLEYPSCVRFSRQPRTSPVNELGYQTPSGISDKTHIIYKLLSETSTKKSALKMGNESCCVTETGDSEIRMVNDSSESSDLKILYNRNAVVAKQSSRQRRVHARSFSSRGTNTDIVQTPKLLEEISQALNLDLSFGYSDTGVNETTKKSPGDEGKRSKRHNFLLVPFIISNRFMEDVQERRSSSCKTVCGKEDGEMDVVKGDVPSDGNLKAHKSSEDLRAGISQVKFHLNQMENQKRDGDYYSVTERCGHHPSMESGDAQQYSQKSEERFLEEVKTLQMRLNALIEGLGMNKMSKADDKLKEIHEESPEASPIVSMESATVNKTESISLDQCMSTIHHEETAVLLQDFSVQVMFNNLNSIRTTSEENTDIVQVAKLEMLDKLSQFPSQATLDPPPQRRRRRLVVCSKSAPHFRVPHDGKAKKTSSLTFTGKIIELIDCLKLKSLNLKMTGEHGRRTEEKAEVNEQEEKMTNILYKKDNRVVVAQKESDGQITLKPNGKVTKFKIIGSTFLGDKSQENGFGKIKVELNDLSNIRISNKFIRRLKSVTNPGVEHGEEANEATMDENEKANDEKETVPRLVDDQPIIEPTPVVEKPEVVKKPRPDERASKIARKTTAKPGEAGTKQKPSDTKKPTTVKPGTDGDQKVNSRLNKPTMSARSKLNGPEANKAQTQVGAAPKSDGKASSPRKTPEKTKKQTQKAAEEKVDVAPVIPLPSASPDDVRNVPSDDSVKTVIHKPCHIQDEPLPPTPPSPPSPTAPPPSDATSEPPSQAVKSIYALTKVILYKDGSQSFEVLEASSTPPEYRLSQSVKTDNGGNASVMAAVNEVECSNNDEKVTVNEVKRVDNVGDSPESSGDTEEKSR